MLAFWVIGAILIVLGVIGLAGALVIRPIKVSKISENISGRDLAGQVMGPGSVSEISENFIDPTTIGINYYPGVLGLRRLGRGLHPPF